MFPTKTQETKISKHRPRNRILIWFFADTSIKIHIEDV